VSEGCGYDASRASRTMVRIFWMFLSRSGHVLSVATHWCRVHRAAAGAPRAIGTL
jgi:hypothetical protein